jgi:hypothetical protein
LQTDLSEKKSLKFKESLPKGCAELMIIGEKGEIYNHTCCFLAYRELEPNNDKIGDRERDLILGPTIPMSIQAGVYKAIVIMYGVQPKVWYAYKEKMVVIE